MKRKILMLALALIMVVSMAAPVWAADTNVTTSGGTGNTNMTYSVAQTFSVIIPAAVTIDPSTKTGSLTVSVADSPRIPYGQNVKIALTTCDFLLSNNGDNLTYTIKDGETSIAEDSIILTHAAGTLTASSKVLSLAVTDSAKYSGDYKDTITFTVSVAP